MTISTETDPTDFFETTLNVKLSSKTLLNNLETLEEFVSRLDKFLITCDNLAYKLGNKKDTSLLEQKFVNEYKTLMGIEDDE